MWRGVLGGAFVTAAAALLAWAPAAPAKDVTITSFDGTRIVAHWFAGKGVDADHKAPTVLEGPGWSSAGDTNSGGGGGVNSIFGVPGISTFINHGYNVLTWDPRGFGQSGGTVEIDDPRYEGRDVQALIDFVARQPEAQLDTDCVTTKKKRKHKKGKTSKKRRKRTTCGARGGDPTLGMAGASYGGGIQNVTAGLDKRVDAIAPTIAWNSLLTALFPEGNIKLGWGSVLVAAGVQGTLPGGAASPATAAGRQDPHFYSILANGTATGTTTQEDLDWMASHGPGSLLGKIKVPTLIMQGTVDTLFPLDEGVANFEAISRNTIPTPTKGKRKRKGKGKGKARSAKRKQKRRPGRIAQQPVPVKMVWFCGGHGVCLTDAGPGSAYLDQRQLAWFDRYLRGDKGTDTGPKFAWIADDGQVRSSTAYPLKPAGRLTGSGSGALPIVPGQGSGGLIFATQAPVAVNVDIPGPPGEANVVGPPHVELSYQGAAAPQNTWVYGQIVNPRNGTVLGNMATPIPLILDGQPHTISRDLEIVAARAPAGGGYTLQLTPSSSLYDIQRSTGAVNFTSVAVTLPLGDPVTASHPSSPPRKKKKHKKHRKH
jgi:ABC-2 type transport system ATP-binding protein